MKATSAQPDVLQEDSRRYHDRLLAYWQKLSGERQFPAETEIQTAEIADLWNHCFLVNTSEKTDQFTYDFMGPSLIEAYGTDLTGQKLTEATEPNIASILNSFITIVKNGESVVDESEFQNSHQQLVKYRCCMVPFGSAPDNVKYILGLMRWKFS